MSIEVEIKAWVRNAAHVDAKLREVCRPLREYLKEDVYFRGPGLDGKHRDVRIRHDDEEAICTFKDKSLRNGLEVNDETEFIVSDAEGLRKLLLALGCEEFLRKVKRGRAYSYENLTVEVSDVEGLGRFIEVERILPDREEVAETEKEIRKFLHTVGIENGDIEPRPYLVMLGALRNEEQV
jgi:adenylate cyclase class 2